MQNILSIIATCSAIFLLLISEPLASASVTTQPHGISLPVLKTPEGEVLYTGTQGSSALVFVTVYTLESESIELTVVVDVRDENDISQMIEIRAIVLDGYDRENVEVAWTPDSEGIYELRSFAVSDWESAVFITSVESQKIPVTAKQE